MQAITIAFGESYQASAHDLAARIPGLIIVTEPLPEDQGENMVHAAFLAKTNFAAYLPADDTGPVIFIDADTQLVPPEMPAVDHTADVLGVRYTHGRIFLPAPWKDIPPDAWMPNTGVLIFRDAEVARRISAAWRARFVADQAVRAHDYDEPAFAAALVATGATYGDLSAVWNASSPGEGVIFLHANTGPRAGTMPRPLPPAAPANTFADQMAAAWAQLPDDVKQAFEPVREAINVLLRSGRPDAKVIAHDQIAAVTVPENWQPYKDAMLQLLHN